MDEKAVTAKWIQQELTAQKGKKTLDLGACGSMYAPHIPAHTGVDLRPPAQTFRSRSFLVSDIRDLEKHDDLADTIIVANIINYYGQAAYNVEPFEYGPARLLWTAAKLTAPGGMIIGNAMLGLASEFLTPAGQIRVLSLLEFKALVEPIGEVLTQAYFVRHRDGYKNCMSPDEEIVGRSYAYSFAEAFVLFKIRPNESLVIYEEYLEKIAQDMPEEVGSGDVFVAREEVFAAQLKEAKQLDRMTEPA